MSLTGNESMSTQELASYINTTAEEGEDLRGALIILCDRIAALQERLRVNEQRIDEQAQTLHELGRWINEQASQIAALERDRRGA